MSKVSALWLELEGEKDEEVEKEKNGVTGESEGRKGLGKERIALVTEG